MADFDKMEEFAHFLTLLLVCAIAGGLIAFLIN